MRGKYEECQRSQAPGRAHLTHRDTTRHQPHGDFPSDQLESLPGGGITLKATEETTGKLPVTPCDCTVTGFSSLSAKQNSNSHKVRKTITGFQELWEAPGRGKWPVTDGVSMALEKEDGCSPVAWSSGGR